MLLYSVLGKFPFNSLSSLFPCFLGIFILKTYLILSSNKKTKM